MKQYVILSAMLLTVPLLGACGNSSNKSSLIVTTLDASLGTVTGSGDYVWGSDVTISATPKDTYQFQGWYVDGVKVGSDATLTFKMPNKPVSYVAKFAKLSFTLSRNSEDTLKGTVSGDEGTITWGSQVAIKAEPKVGYVFAGWYLDGELKSSDTIYTFKMPQANVDYVAKFVDQTYNVTVTTGDNSRGIVTGGGEYAKGTRVFIKASPNEHYVFEGWYSNGEFVSNNPEYTFKAQDKPLIYIAKFSKCTYHLKVHSFEEDKGTVAGTSGEIKWSTIATIIAIPKEGYKFLGWYIKDELISRDLIYSFAMPKGDTSFEAKFITNNSYLLTLHTPDSKIVRVSGGGVYVAGKGVTIKAIVDDAYNFDGWYDEHDHKVSSSIEYTFMMPEWDVHYTVKFSPKR